ncbi:MAG: monovalent cation/H+ antiporter subunit E [Anaerolineae bacterium]
MFARFVLVPLPLTIGWVLLTNHPTWDGFLVGYVLSLLVAQRVTQSTKVSEIEVNFAKLPGQLVAFAAYSVGMFWAIFVSGIDVALRIIGTRPLRPGIIAVPVQNENEANAVIRDIVAAASAHSITITPGELVVDYNENRTIMYVHVLDVETSLKHIESAQADRVKVFRRILGRD